jgi:hypothetical protein
VTASARPSVFSASVVSLSPSALATVATEYVNMRYLEITRKGAVSDEFVADCIAKNVSCAPVQIVSVKHDVCEPPSCFVIQNLPKVFPNLHVILLRLLPKAGPEDKRLLILGVDF